MSVSLPTPEQERDLHRRLLANDKTASADLAVAYHEAIILFLRQKNDARLSEDLFEDAAADTWESMCKSPASYDGSGSLWSFLCRSAQCDLRNRLAAETRRRKRISCDESVEQLPDDGIDLRDIAEEAVRVRETILPLVVEGLTDGERDCLELYLDGEKKTSRFAAALGITGQSKEEQKLVVKRTKDKLKKRLERVRRDHGNTP